MREHLRRQRGCDVVTFADAMDVIAGTGSAAKVRAALRRMTGGRSDVVVAAAEPACWIGVKCSEQETSSMLRAAYGEARSSTNMSFVNSGQYVGSRSGLAAFLDYADRVLEAARAGALPTRSIDFDDRRGKTAAFLDDQGLLASYAVAYPDKVIIDDAGELFGSMKRWFVLQDEAYAEGPMQVARNGVFHIPACDVRAHLKASSDPGAKRAWFHPSCDGMRLDTRKKRFATGIGHHCLLPATNATIPNFFWCKASDTIDDLVYDAAGLPIRPLLGWHANGYAGHVLLTSLLAARPTSRR